MKHRIIFREISHQDLDKQCIFMPEEHDFEIHLEALVNDIKQLECVTDAHRDGSHAIMVVTSSTLDALKKNLIPFLQHHWAYLRIEL